MQENRRQEDRDFKIDQNSRMFIFNPDFSKVKIAKHIERKSNPLLALMLLFPTPNSEEFQKMIEEARPIITYMSPEDDDDKDSYFAIITSTEADEMNKILALHVFPKDVVGDQIEMLMKGLGEDTFLNLKPTIIRVPTKDEFDDYLYNAQAVVFGDDLTEKSGGIGLKARKYHLILDENSKDPDGIPALSAVKLIRVKPQILEDFKVPSDNSVNA